MSKALDAIRDRVFRLDAQIIDEERAAVEMFGGELACHLRAAHAARLRAEREQALIEYFHRSEVLRAQSARRVAA